MSAQNPPGTPADGPDPFAELLKGLIEEPTEQAAAAPAEPAAPAAAQPPVTSSADVPTVAFTPFEAPVVLPSAEQSPVTGPPLEDPTIAFAPVPAVDPTASAPAFPAPDSSLPEPIPAAGTPSAGLAPTVVLPGATDPTAATTVLAGGIGGGGLPPGGPPRGGGFRDWDPRRKALFITLISIAGVLLIALVILLVVILGNRDADPTPTSSPTSTSAPTPTPTRTSTPTPTPTPTVRPAVQAFTASSNTAVCPDTNAGTRVAVQLAWTVIGDAADIAIASAPSAIDAFTNPFQTNLPTTASGFEMPFACDSAQLTYSLTVAAKDGQRYSGAVTIVRQYTPPPPAPNPTISSWSASPTTLVCPADPSDPAPTVTLSWNVANWQAGAFVEFGIGGPGEFSEHGTSTGAITSGTDFPDFPCADGQQTYFLTLYAPGGQQLDQKSLTVTGT